MNIKKLGGTFSVCKVADYSRIDLEAKYCFVSKTEDENSLVCPEEEVPSNVLVREDGWTAFRIEGILDFSLIGILAEITGLLAGEKIPVFVISTFNTDYILVKKEFERKAISRLTGCGYEIISEDLQSEYFEL